MLQFNISRRTLLQGSAALGLGLGGIAHAQKSIQPLARLLVGFPPGGMPDVITRRVGHALQGRYAKAIAVENKAGAGGQLAVSEAVRSRPDGATLLFTPSSMLTLLPHTMKKVPYNPLTDVVPVSAAGQAVLALAVGSAVPASVNSIKDLIAWIKSDPTNAVYATGAPGSPMHFLGMLLSEAAGVPMRHVAYRGTPPALLDVISGQIPIVLSSQGEFFANYKQRSIRVLAVASPKRTKGLPEVPTFAEQGYPQIDASGGFMGFYMPRNTPAPLVASAHSHLVKAINTPEVLQAMVDMGIEPSTSTPDELKKMVVKEHAMWAEVVKRTGFTIEN